MITTEIPLEEPDGDEHDDLDRDHAGIEPRVVTFIPGPAGICDVSLIVPRSCAPSQRTPTRVRPARCPARAVAVQRRPRGAHRPRRLLGRGAAVRPPHFDEVPGLSNACSAASSHGSVRREGRRGFSDRCSERRRRILGPRLDDAPGHAVRCAERQPRGRGPGRRPAP